MAATVYQILDAQLPYVGLMSTGQIVAAFAAAAVALVALVALLVWDLRETTRTHARLSSAQRAWRMAQQDLTRRRGRR